MYIENKKIFLYGLIVFVIGLFLFSASYSFAQSRLETSISRTQASVITMAQSGTLIGIAIGGFMLASGLANIGRIILASSTFGAAVVYLAPAFIEYVKRMAT